MQIVLTFAAAIVAFTIALVARDPISDTLQFVGLLLSIAGSVMLTRVGGKATSKHIRYV